MLGFEKKNQIATTYWNCAREQSIFSFCCMIEKDNFGDDPFFQSNTKNWSVTKKMLRICNSRFIKNTYVPKTILITVQPLPGQDNLHLLLRYIAMASSSIVYLK